jgi:hypothetical protein
VAGLRYVLSNAAPDADAADRGGIMHRKSFVFGVLGTVAALTLATPAMATNFSCTGPVLYLGVSSAGGVTMNIGNGVWTICSLTSTHGTVTKEACAGWYSGILTARASGKTIMIYFSQEENGANASCTTLGNWTYPLPYFLQLD